MSIYRILVILFWLVFVLYWSVSWSRAKKIARQESSQRSSILPIVFVVLFVFGRHVLHAHFTPHARGMEILGTILSGLGIAFAIWARWHLGKNWNSRPSIQEGHELVTSGPYRFVRHPIYTGMLAAVLGSALVGGGLWIVIFILFGVEAFRRIRAEERLMTEQFPKEYPEYKKRTKALIPFVW